MERYISDKLLKILKIEYGFKIYKILDFYMEFNKSYDVYIFFKTNDELKTLTESIKEEIKFVYIEYLKENGYIPNEIESTKFYFNSDENVQKKYKGNYFYATR